jgi:hypothetical protein
MPLIKRPIKKNKLPGPNNTRSTLAGNNKYLEAQEKIKKNKNISTKLGLRKKSIDKKAREVLTVKAKAYEISKLRYNRLNEKKKEIINDKTINSKQKELYLKILDRQIDASYEKYITEKKKRGL